MQPSRTGCIDRHSLGLHDARSHVMGQAGSNHWVLLEQICEIEDDAGGRGVDVDLEDCHDKGDGCQR